MNPEFYSLQMLVEREALRNGARLMDVEAFLLRLATENNQ